MGNGSVCRTAENCTNIICQWHLEVTLLGMFLLLVLNAVVTERKTGVPLAQYSQRQGHWPFSL